MIGGPGQSYPYGGLGDTLMIAGTTSFDSNDAALTAILNEWGSRNSWATRIGHLQGTIAGGVNGSSLLKAATMQSDRAKVLSFAGAGGLVLHARGRRLSGEEAQRYGDADLTGPRL